MEFKLTVKEYIKKYNISNPTFYIYQREQRINTVLVDGKRFAEDKAPKDKHDDVNNTNTSTNPPNTPPNTHTNTHDVYNEYKLQIEELKEEVKLQKKEIKLLNEKIDNIRINQTNEIINLQKVKDEQLKTFMELVSNNTNNILSYKQESTVNTTNTDTVEAEIVDNDETISLKKYIKSRHKHIDKQKKLKDKIIKDYKKNPLNYKRVENKLYLYTNISYNF